MAVALRDSTQFTVQSDGTATLTLPTGTAAGDVLVCWCEDGRRNQPAETAGWYSSAHRFGACWWRVVTAADVTAGSVALLGEVTGLVSVTGCRGIGTRRDGKSITASETGAAVLVTAFRPPPASTVDPSGSRLDSVVEHEDWPHSWWLVTGGVAGQSLGLSGTNSDASYYARELLPTVGPDAPTLSTPLAGAEVDQAAVTTLTWVHNSTSGQSQAACKVRIRVVGAGSWSYVAADGTLTGTETTLTQAAQSTTIDASALTVTSNYEWAVATQDQGTWSAWSPEQQVRAVAVPTITDVGVTCPAGDLSPLVQVSWSMGYGSPAWWQVRVTPSASGASDVGTLYDSGSMVYAGTQEIVVPAYTAWTDGSACTAWVRVAQTGGLVSVWTADASTFTVDWTAPPAPSAVAGSNATTPPRVTITSTAARDGWELEWDPTGTGTWEPYADAVQAGSGNITVDVPLAPYGSGVAFRGRVFTLSEGVRLYSPWTESAEFTSTDAGAYLVDDVDLSDHIAVTVGEDGDRERVQGVSVVYGHGAETARVDLTETMGERGVTTLTVLSSGDRSDVVEWLTTRGVWRLRWPPERDGSTLEDAGSTRMSLAGAVGVGRLAQVNVSARQVKFGWVSQ